MCFSPNEMRSVLSWSQSGLNSPWNSHNCGKFQPLSDWWWYIFQCTIEPRAKVTNNSRSFAVSQKYRANRHGFSWSHCRSHQNKLRCLQIKLRVTHGQTAQTPGQQTFRFRHIFGKAWIRSWEFLAFRDVNRIWPIQSCQWCGQRTLYDINVPKFSKKVSTNTQKHIFQC